ECEDSAVEYGRNGVNSQALNGKSVLTDAVGTGNSASQVLNDMSISTKPFSFLTAIKLTGQSPIHFAVDSNHSDCMELLIENGFYMDMRRSTLYFAVSRDIPCVELLLNAGAKPELDLLCCLLVAVRAGRYEIVKLFLAR
uniref:Uncharacterized protein n=1 Tax=Salmo trutta TaxID=8032 RepID=A0A673XHA2_SALTR